MCSHTQGVRITADQLEPEYFKLFGNGNITSMFPLASYDNRKKAFDLKIEVHKSNPLAIKLGGNFSFGSYNVGFAEIRFNPIWRYPAYMLVNGYFGQAYSSVMASGRIYFNHPRTWFLGGSVIYNRLSFFNNTAYFFDIQQRSSISDKTVTGNIFAGIPIRNHSLLRIGSNFTTAFGFYYLANLLESSDTLTRIRFKYTNPSVIYEFNTLDRKQYASSGTRIRASASLVYGKETNLEGTESSLPVDEPTKRFYYRITGLYSTYFRIAGHLYGGTHVEMNLSGQPLFSSYISTLTYCQPFQPLPQSKILFLPGYRSPSWGAAGLKAIFKISKEVELRSEAYIFQPYRLIELNKISHLPDYGKQFAQRNYISGLTLVWNSILGPLGVGIDYYSSSNDKLLFTINFGYILFNPGQAD